MISEYRSIFIEVIMKSLVNMVFTTLALLLGLVGLIQSSDISDFQNTPSNTNDLFRIEGKIFTHDSLPLSKQYLVETKVFVNYGQYFGFLK